ncbi:MAG TPA: DinB family protein [Puia sp.]|nr:DinB family protein [Puia sp.]
MKQIIEKLEKIIAEYSVRLRAIDDDIYAYKPQPEKWSKKEILGHLVDSAQNNLRRFIVSQYEEPSYIVYNQDKWVTISNYQQYQIRDLIELWILLNKHICIILANTPTEMAMRECITNNQQPHTIEWLAGDYIKHLLHHLHQVLELEEVDYP